MAKIIAAANVNVETFWPGLFAKALQGRNIGDLICNVGSSAAAAPAAAAAGMYILLTVIINFSFQFKTL